MQELHIPVARQRALDRYPTPRAANLDPAILVTPREHVARNMERLGLTCAQRRATWGLLRGLTNKEIATELQLAEGTIKHVLRDVMRAAEARSRTELVLRLLNIAPDDMRESGD